jgi:aldose 1-epimerase
MTRTAQSAMANAVTLTSPSGELTATFLPDAGMIGTSLKQGETELLAQRRGLGAYLEGAKTFALPLLYPWANRLLGWEYDVAGQHVELRRDDPLIHVDPPTGWPIHGVLAACPDWRVTATSPTAIRAQLDYGAEPARLAVFPFPHRVSYSAELSEGALTVTLLVTPTGAVPVPISFGFHPYLRPGGRREDWQLQGSVASLAGPMAGRSFDDGFTDVRGGHFSVTSSERTLGIEFLEGFTSVQVFSPPDSEFICFEPMTAPTDALRTGRGLSQVAPGESFTARFAITVGPPGPLPD